MYAKTNVVSDICIYANVILIYDTYANMVGFEAT